MGSFIDLTGKRFGRLEVICRHSLSPGKQIKWLCRCDCGNQIVAFGINLKKINHTTSCGCWNKEIATISSTKHGMAGSKNTLPSKEWLAWRNMKSRCYDENNIGYNYYGGRGIKVCKQWLESFELFYQDMGEKPTSRHSLERIRVNEGYSPENCKWATSKEQANNTRRNKYINYNGITLTQRQWEEKLKMPLHSLYKSLKKGKEISEIFAKYSYEII